MTAEDERDRLAHREAALGEALDQCLSVLLAVPGEYRDELVGLVATARPGHPLATPLVDRRERREWMDESLRRLAAVPGELGRGAGLDYVAGTRAENARLAAENRRLRGLIDADPDTVAEFDGAVGLKHWTARYMAASVYKDLCEAGAKNYFIFDLHPPGGPALSVTIQVREGITPMDTIGRLETEVAALRAELAARPAPAETFGAPEQ